MRILRRLSFTRKYLYCPLQTEVRKIGIREILTRLKDMLAGLVDGESQKRLEAPRDSSRDLLPAAARSRLSIPGKPTTEATKSGEDI